MKTRGSILLLIVLALAIEASAMTQPDISLIGDFRAFTGNWKNLDGSRTDRNGNLNMSFQELEIAASGYLNPYAQAWATIGFHGEDIHVEEAYANIERGLPLRSQIRFGRMLVDFGKLNSYHLHAYPFVDRPLLHRIFLGDEGWKDVGLNASILLPTGIYSKLSLNVLKGDLFAGAHHHHEEDAEEEEHDEGDRGSERPIYSGRLSIFLPVSERGNLDIGVSGMHGLYRGKNEELTRNLYAAMYAVDAKFKQKWSDYQSLTVQGELIGRRSETADESGGFGHVTTVGGLVFFDFQFRKRYNIGLMLERTPGVFDNGAEDYDPGPPEELNNTPHAVFDAENRTQSITVFGGFSLLEETTVIRLFSRFTSFDIKAPSRLVNTGLTAKRSETTVGVQLLWSLGPHKPHEF